MTKLKKMAPDGSYGEYISGYGDDAQELKEKFLRDANALLRQVGTLLAVNGLTEKEVSQNPSGMAGSGEVYAKFWRPDNPGWRVSVEVGTTHLQTGREDGVCILAMWVQYEPAKDGEKAGYRRTSNGPNQWISPDLNAQELADQLLLIYDPVNTPKVTTAHTKSAGSVPYPPPTITSPAQAPAWFQAHRAINDAFREDAAGNQEAPETTQMGLFDTLTTVQE